MSASIFLRLICAIVSLQQDMVADLAPFVVTTKLEQLGYEVPDCSCCAAANPERPLTRIVLHGAIRIQ